MYGFRGLGFTGVGFRGLGQAFSAKTAGHVSQARVACKIARPTESSGFLGQKPWYVFGLTVASGCNPYLPSTHNDSNNRGYPPDFGVHGSCSWYIRGLGKHQAAQQLLKDFDCRQLSQFGLLNFSF